MPVALLMSFATVLVSGGINTGGAVLWWWWCVEVIVEYEPPPPADLDEDGCRRVPPWTPWWLPDIVIMRPPLLPAPLCWWCWWLMVWCRESAADGWCGSVGYSPAAAEEEEVEWWRCGLLREAAEKKEKKKLSFLYYFCAHKT